MDERRIIQTIKDLAEKLADQETVYTRADLAYELKDIGIEGDSIEVSQWVYKAYIRNRKSKIIRKAFVNNEKKRYIVDEFCIYPLAEKGCAKELSTILENTLEKSMNDLHSLEFSISKALLDKPIEKSNGILSTITGTKGVANIQATAASVFQRYTDMVDAYDTAKGEVKAIITDFVSLRNYVNEIYCKYAFALTDIFGDSIKVVSPELFDFDSIQYLDVQGMLKNIQLEYNQVMEKCGELMSSISEDFSNSLNCASGIYRQIGNKKVGLMLAGLEMINHYLDAGQRTTELHGQLLSLKNNVKHDATQIKGDMGRLLLIYKGMNDLHIPRAEAFYRYSQQILESNLNHLIETLYNTPELSGLKREREKLLEQHKEINRMISDSQFNIDYYASHITECEALIDSMKSQYLEAKSSKPSKPFFLLNLLSLGALSKKYNREIAEWYHNCQPVIKQYEELQVDINLDKEDMVVHQKAYEDGIRDLKNVNKGLILSSQKMKKAIHADKETMKEIVRHLDVLIKLLRIAKEIIETKLDAKQRKVVTITDYRNEKLPDEITRNIRTFSQELNDALQIDPSFAQHSLNGIGDGETVDYSEEDLQTVTQAQNTAIQNAVSLFESWANLQKVKLESNITSEKYDAELSKLQEQFRKEMQAMDDKSTLLRKALKQINISKDEKHLKEGLLALADVKCNLTSKDWDDFFNGTKTIEI